MCRISFDTPGVLYLTLSPNTDKCIQPKHSVEKTHFGVFESSHMIKKCHAIKEKIEENKFSKRHFMAI